MISQPIDYSGIHFHDPAIVGFAKLEMMVAWGGHCVACLCMGCHYGALWIYDEINDKTRPFENMAMKATPGGGIDNQYPCGGDGWTHDEGDVGNWPGMSSDGALLHSISHILCNVV